MKEVKERDYLIPGCSHEFSKKGFCKICGGWVEIISKNGRFLGYKKFDNKKAVPSAGGNGAKIGKSIRKLNNND